MVSRIKVGLIGCGVISATHLRAWRKIDGVELAGVYDVDRDLAATRARAFGVAQVFDGIEEVMEASDVVDVCTPPHTHAAIAAAVIDAGRHLIIEKPLVTSVEEWDQLATLLTRSSGKVCVVHNLKFLRSVQKAKEWVGAGRIGRPIGVTRRFLTNPATDRMLRGNGHWSHRLPGGRWFETLPHELYLLHWLAGPLDLSGVTCTRTDRAPAGVPADEVVITMRGKECVATIHYSANCGANVRTLELLGTEGSIWIDLLSDAAVLRRLGDSKAIRAAGRVFLQSAATALTWAPDRIGYVQKRVMGETSHAGIIRAFTDHVRGTGADPTPIDEIDFVVRNAELIGQEIERAVLQDGATTFAFASR